MRWLRSDAEARCLLPGGGGAGLALVLFCDARTQGAAVTSFSRGLPVAARGFVVDVHSAAETARWFGVRTTPVLAAIEDGALLMLETRCLPESCREVLAGALETLAGMERCGERG